MGNRMNYKLTVDNVDYIARRYGEKGFEDRDFVEFYAVRSSRPNEKNYHKVLRWISDEDIIRRLASMASTYTFAELPPQGCERGGKRSA
jgi:hypothetical protein